MKHVLKNPVPAEEAGVAADLGAVEIKPIPVFCVEGCRVNQQTSFFFFGRARWLAGEGFVKMSTGVTMPPFKLEAPFQPCGHQPEAIAKLTEGINRGKQHQVLLGVTGSGKTFTMANLIERVQKPTLVLVHNKTLAGQLYQEFKQFFPQNAVEYFVSYYDYYQPEAYIPQSDTYIAKDASINDAIDQMRHSATTALLQRNDVLIVSSVSCIYGLGSPEVYHDMLVYLEEGMEVRREKILSKL